MKTKLVLLLGFFALLTSCNNDENSSIEIKDRKDIALSRAEEQLANESTEFAFRLFQQINSTEKQSNWMISPLSASMALGMMTNGAAGNTLEEIKSTLGFSDFNLDGMNVYYQKLTTELLDLDNTTQLNIANSIWVKEGLPIYETFIKANQEKYDAKVNHINFSSPEAKSIINNWCTEETNNNIKNASSSFSANTSFALINALYFKGIWKKQFKKENTKKESFTNSDGTKTEVPMMNQTEHFLFANYDNFNMAEFQYGNEAFSMVIILPNEGITLNESLQNLTYENWEEWEKRRISKELKVKLPRFEINYEKDLTENIQALGVKEAFKENADFSSMSSENFHLNLLTQFASIKVNEEGTEATTSTIIGSDTNIAPNNSNFYVNRPFAFMIKEKSTGTILFMGKVTKL
ncbi:MAG: serpin family protein [Bacteroidaceae bacterium]|nr:serpin family protein [Bacteroidaceae bacterium]